MGVEGRKVELQVVEALSIGEKNVTVGGGQLMGAGMGGVEGWMGRGLKVQSIVILPWRVA